jgi:hypothetical protein
MNIYYIRLSQNLKDDTQFLVGRHRVSWQEAAKSEMAAAALRDREEAWAVAGITAVSSGSVAKIKCEDWLS